MSIIYVVMCYPQICEDSYTLMKAFPCQGKAEEYKNAFEYVDNLYQDCVRAFIDNDLCAAYYKELKRKGGCVILPTFSIRNWFINYMLGEIDVLDTDNEYKKFLKAKIHDYINNVSTKKDPYIGSVEDFLRYKGFVYEIEDVEFQS